MAKSTIGRAQIVKAAAILESNITRLENGLVEYANGYTDAKLAKEVGCELSNIRSLRQELFGRLRTWQPTVATVAARAHPLLEELIDKHNKLVVMLAVNRVVDCKHLRVGAEAPPLINGK